MPAKPHTTKTQHNPKKINKQNCKKKKKKKVSIMKIKKTRDGAWEIPEKV